MSTLFLKKINILFKNVVRVRKKLYKFNKLLYNLFRGNFIMNRLKILREEKQLNQIDIANFLTISVPAYSYYENEKRDIPTEILKK